MAEEKLHCKVTLCLMGDKRTVMRNAEEIWGFPLIRRYVGGKDGGRSVLTKQAEIILERYEEMNEALHDVADRQFRQWFNDEELHKLQKMEG